MALGNLTSAFVNFSDNAPATTVPSGAVAGDSFVLAIITAIDYTITWPSGFTEIAESALDPTLGSRMRVALRTATGSESGSFTATASGYSRWIAACVIVPGTSTLDDSDATGGYLGFIGAATPFTLTGGSITTTGASRQIVWIGGTRPGSGAGTSTPALPSGFTSGGTAADNGNGGVLFLGDKSEASSGTYSYNGTQTHSVADTQSSLVATLAFTPTAAPPVITLQPANTRAFAGDLATFTVAATGGTLSYQWKLNGSNVGTDQASYTRPAAIADTGAVVTVVVTDSNGSTTSSAAVLTVLAAATRTLKPVPRTTVDSSAAGWFSEYLAPAGVFDRDMLVTLSAGSGTAVGLAVETDAALALSALQIKPVGLAAEADAALALAAVGIRATGLAAETDAALALARLQIKATGLATETDAALALAGVQLRAVGLATETDAAFALAAKQIAATGLASETDAALSLTGKQLRAVGLASETDTALALSAAAGTAVGLAAETDTALTLAGVQRRAVGMASEADQAFALAAVQKLVTGLAAEADAALALSARQIAAAGLASESDLAFAMASVALLFRPGNPRFCFVTPLQRDITAPPLQRASAAEPLSRAVTAEPLDRAGTALPLRRAAYADHT